jgi:hypothetical protein
VRTQVPYRQPPPPIPSNDTPEEVKGWLRDRGWTYNTDDPNTGDELYTSVSRTGYFTWSEAVAYEFYRFINLGAK